MPLGAIWVDVYIIIILLPNTDSAVVITNFEHKNEFYDQESSNLVY